MQGQKQWMWLGLCGLVWAGCAEPMGARLEQETRRPANGTVFLTDARAAAEMPPTPPPVTWLSGSTDVSTLWRGTTSARKYVLLVAYTLPKNDLGVVGPPRFRAFGVDPSRNAYVFVVDGERRGLLGSFTESMLAQDAVLITTPPGTSFYGACAVASGPGVGARKARAGGVNKMASEDGGMEEDGGSGGMTACGTEPVIRVPVTTGEGGHDPFEGIDFGKLIVLPHSLDTGLLDFQVPGAILVGP